MPRTNPNPIPIPNPILTLTLTLTRYEDGWVEIIELQEEGVLEMLHPDYISFPFDSQGLNVKIDP